MDKSKWRWALFGATIGFLVFLADLITEWRERLLYPWTSNEYVAHDLSMFVGSVLGAVLIGFVLGASGTFAPGGHNGTPPEGPVPSNIAKTYRASRRTAATSGRSCSSRASSNSRIAVVARPEGGLQLPTLGRVGRRAVVL